jgi:hypothetical protein
LTDAEREAKNQECQVFLRENLTLSDSERAAVEWCLEMARLHATDCDDELATIRNLLERLG